MHNPDPGEWAPLTLGSDLFRPPSAPTPARVIGKLEQLSFNDMNWADFERLLWRIMRDGEGLRHAQLYGERGQKQFGLDIVALAPDGDGTALQSKKYKRFGPAELKAAVKKFRETDRPFEVQRFIIAVARPVLTTKAIDELAVQRAALHPIELELWDAQSLSVALREHPEIVIEFFGTPTAEAFCLPYELDVRIVPADDAVAVSEAIARTPEETTGAQDLFDRSDRLTDPLEALACVEEGQRLLREAGYGPHAAKHGEARYRLLEALARTAEVARGRLDDIWAALERGLPNTAQRASELLAKLASASRAEPEVQTLRRVGDLARGIYQDPLGRVPDPGQLAVGGPEDRARLFVLAGETALALDNRQWLLIAADPLAALASELSLDRVLRTRVRLLHAEATGEWSDLLFDARRRKLGNDLLGLVAARHARDRALRGRFQEADLEWDEASSSASLARMWSDAATWIHSRRAFRAVWNPFTSDELLPLEIAIRERTPGNSVLVSAQGSIEQALGDLSADRLRSAATAAQRALRDAVASGDWAGEERARRALAEVLRASGEPAQAARHLIRAGAVKAVEALAHALPNDFIDATDDLGASNYWTVGTACRLLAGQADLVPDELVDRLGSFLADEVAGAESGTIPDRRAFATSRYTNAVKLAGGIAGRLSVDHADALLRHFESQRPVEPNRYRFHDADEALAVARIAVAQPDMAPRAVAHLVDLLARSQPARNATTYEAIEVHSSLSLPLLRQLAASGSSWARELLATLDATPVDAAVAQDALQRLTAPLKHQNGVFTIGTNAIGDSLLVRDLPPTELARAVAELLRRGSDPHVSSIDRGSYLGAAANLADSLDNADKQVFFDAAIQLVANPMPSEHDQLSQQFSHPLGALRIAGDSADSRGEALLVAAVLAQDDDQRGVVLRHSYSLLGDRGDYWPARILPLLGNAIRTDLAFIASQGWALRTRAAAVWVQSGHPPHLGTRLANDPDVRVRQALARGLADAPAEQHSGLRELLKNDPSHMVRTALRNP